MFRVSLGHVESVCKDAVVHQLDQLTLDGARVTVRAAISIHVNGTWPTAGITSLEDACAHTIRRGTVRLRQEGGKAATVVGKRSQAKLGEALYEEIVCGTESATGRCQVVIEGE